MQPGGHAACMPHFGLGCAGVRDSGGQRKTDTLAAMWYSPLLLQFEFLRMIDTCHMDTRMRYMYLHSVMVHVLCVTMCLVQSWWWLPRSFTAGPYFRCPKFVEGGRRSKL
jgi:hypothetical protein